MLQLENSDTEVPVLYVHTPYEPLENFMRSTFGLVIILLAGLGLMFILVMLNVLRNVGITLLTFRKPRTLRELQADLNTQIDESSDRTSVVFKPINSKKNIRLFSIPSLPSSSFTSFTGKKSEMQYSLWGMHMHPKPIISHSHSQCPRNSNQHPIFNIPTRGTTSEPLSGRTTCYYGLPKVSSVGVGTSCSIINNTYCHANSSHNATNASSSSTRNRGGRLFNFGI